MNFIDDICKKDQLFFKEGFFSKDQKKILIYRAIEMNKQFPNVSLSECLKTLSDNWDARIRFNNVKNCEKYANNEIKT